MRWFQLGWLPHATGPEVIGPDLLRPPRMASMAERAVVIAKRALERCGG